MFAKARRVVGLDIGSSALKAIELKRDKDGYELVFLAVETLPPETVVEGTIRNAEALSEAISRLFEEQKITARDVASSVSGHSVIIKQLAAPALDGAELHQWVRSVAGQHIPFELSEVDLSYHLLDTEEGPSGRPLLLVAAKKETVRSQSEAIRKAGRNLVVMDVDSFALANCYEVNYAPGPEDRIALVDIGAGHTNVSVLRGTVPLFTRDVSVGGSQYTEALMREFGIGYEEAEQIKRGEGDSAPLQQATQVLHSFLELVVVEIRRTFDYYRASSGEPIAGILLAGGCSRVARLGEALSQELSVPVESIDPFRRIEIRPERFDQERVRELAPQLAVSVGLALRGFDPA
ncbi:MAG TPA: type IV pilus assembly protein PilM [Patescibacteria group bacterium]|nr:type IV pilus assembly protein PilM [Patescibacteria group bacterium]